MISSVIVGASAQNLHRTKKTRKSSRINRKEESKLVLKALQDNVKRVLITSKRGLLSNSYNQEDLEEVLRSAECPKVEIEEHEINKLIHKVYMRDALEENAEFLKYFETSFDENGDEVKVRTGLSWIAFQWRDVVAWNDLFTKPNSSFQALTYALMVMIFVILSVTTFCLETITHNQNNPNIMWTFQVIDYACLAVFTVDFILQVATCQNYRAFIISPMTWVELSSVLPFYIELIVIAATTGVSSGPASMVSSRISSFSNTTVANGVAGGISSSGASQTRLIRIIRLLRILRLLTLVSRFRVVQIIMDALRNSVDVLLLLAFLLVIILVVFGSIMYYIEPNTTSAFTNIPVSMYYVQVTLTTTGYGDIYPVTPWGKFVAGLMMLCCLVTVSLPISVVGNNFSTLCAGVDATRNAVAAGESVWPQVSKVRSMGQMHQSFLDEILALLLTQQSLLIPPLLSSKRALGKIRAAIDAANRGTVPLNIGLITSQLSSAWDDAKLCTTRIQIMEILLEIATAMCGGRPLEEQMKRLQAAALALEEWRDRGAAVVLDSKDLISDLESFEKQVNACVSRAEAQARHREMMSRL
uniref:Ion transport domain-containing protein n=1 Tax=Polytomella parva TaxID=51329 RepID=A0A7S0V8V6_9CHLO|mmetsp:Transcript_30429/g.55576  ORF Transcript_30429/g.55576 Transcript_30429/m.55576 type:complete len:585 (+) Transcript_30429:118-1872(+)|eukprot:CAMPEP_0175076806 /NCGR_PEP_ID=MMETSP0052_2-20121109/22975_1 /TAXON_ID=51329 ORGANISM="Polytomella parva, Strain SAG 63-3" /NCGR_SAMPLE_ID=MMETSP0052_2 /ASSEMBLY_ACC=CAM_ASM_000194 /LENGTH=584 /DNA_ID=CAMNT_0016346073 /DNA_START=32 /DNA_END=1786 /DNA_ORIENTATION=+